MKILIYNARPTISFDKILRLLLRTNTITHYINICRYINYLCLLATEVAILLSEDISFSLGNIKLNNRIFHKFYELTQGNNINKDKIRIFYHQGTVERGNISFKLINK